MLKCKSLLSKKKLYKHELSNLSKEFESLKNKFSKLVESNEKLANDLKSSNSLKDQLKKSNDENLKLSREALELKNSISKFKKGKETLDSLLDSQKLYGNTHEIGYTNGMSSLSSFHIKFVKTSCDFTPSTSTPLEIQAFKAKKSHVSNDKASLTRFNLF